MVCSPRRHYVDGYCATFFHSAKELGYTIYFSIPLHDDLHLYDGYDLLHTLPGILENLIISRTLGDTVRATVNPHFVPCMVLCCHSCKTLRCCITSTKLIQFT